MVHSSKQFKRVNLSTEYHSNEWCQAGNSIQMSGFGERLREERKRLGLSQAAFGEIGGVKANAQANYEKEERHPDSTYLTAIAQAGVDVLYVLTGQRTPRLDEGLSEREKTVLDNYRSLPEEDRTAVHRLTNALKESYGKGGIKKEAG